MEEQNDFTWQLAFFLVGSLFIFGVGASVIAWQFFSTARARASVAREQAYQKLAESTATALERVNEELHRATGELQRTNTELGDLRIRAVEMERILKEVG